MSDINGIIMPQIQMTNLLVQMLEGVLADVKAGRVTTVAVIAIPPLGEQVHTPFGGPNIGGLISGSVFLQWKIKDFMMAQQQPSRIPLVRAVPVG